MKKPENENKIIRIRNLLLIVLGLLAMGAIGGGAVLIISPSGEMLGMPLSELENSPFNSFLIPGIILFSVLGIIPLLLIIALIKKPESWLADQFNIFEDMHCSWTFGIIVFLLIFFGA